MQGAEIRDIALAQAGQVKIDWARAYMPLLNEIRSRFKREQPFAGMKIAISIHLEAKTAYLAHVLRAGGLSRLCRTRGGSGAVPAPSRMCAVL